MVALQSLILTGNELNGTLPGAWGAGMDAVERMLLGYNRFIGTLPASWARWSHVSDMQVDGNSLSGR